MQTDVQLDPAGLLPMVNRRPHDPNQFYPHQKYGDFASDYDAELSVYPWNTIGNCRACGRLQERMGSDSVVVVRYDPFVGKRISAVLCSPVCADLYAKESADEIRHWKRLSNVEN